MRGAVYRQSTSVVFTVRDQMCPMCKKQSANDNLMWSAVVQIRQHGVARKHTLMHLEELMMTHKAHAHAIGIQRGRDAGGGLDVFFKKNSSAKTFVEFVQARVPCRIQTTKSMVGHDGKSNVHRFQAAHKLEVVPVSKNDLLLLPRRAAAAMGLPLGVALCTHVSSTAHVVHIPHRASKELFTGEITASSFYRDPFRPLVSSDRLVVFQVLDITLAAHGDDDAPLSQGDCRRNAKKNKNRKTMRLADVEVCLESNIGETNASHFCTTHLGKVLCVGQLVKGYYLKGNVFSDNDLKPLERSGIELPEVVLVEPISLSLGEAPHKDQEVESE